jgi:hypothetical protein
VLRLWDGISVYESEAQAREKARQFPDLGTHLARLEIPMSIGARIERTTRSEGHHTIWAPAAMLHACIVSIVPL